jgi:hypothetical protein
MLDVQAIVAADLPVLCIDTCSILDIMRDPTREAAKPHDRQAAIDLVAVAEAGKLACLMAEQVAIEFADHDLPIQEEAMRNLDRLRDQIERVNKVSAVYGAPGIVNLTHLDDHVLRAREVVGRWLAQFQKITPDPSVSAKAFARMNACVAPAEKGKESSKDCLVYETYLETMRSLRRAGLMRPLVFLSSNTRDYLTEGRKLKSEIAAEFAALDVTYASNMSAAKYALGS